MNMQKQKPIWSKILAMLCALALCISMVPAASAARPTQPTMSSLNKVTVCATGIKEFWTINGDESDPAISETPQTDGGVTYTASTTEDFITLTMVPAGTEKLSKSVSFYAVSTHEPVIDTGETGVSYLVSNAGVDATNSALTWWSIELILPTSGTETEVTLNAEALPTYTVTFDEKESQESKGYTLIKVSSDTVKHGESYQFYVIPKTGYQAPKVTVTRGESDSASISPSEDGTVLYTVSDIQSNITITIDEAQPQPYTVNFIPGDEYSFEGANSTTISNDKATVNYGGSVSFKVNLDNDYDKSDVTVYANGSKLEAIAGVYTINNITMDQTVSVVGVEKNKYTVKLPTNTDGYYITTVNPTVVESGGQFTFKVVVNPGYDADSVSVTVDNDQTVTKNDDNSYTISNITNDTSISISGIEAAQYNVTTRGSNATVKVDGTPIEDDYRASYGNLTFTVTPDAGYKVDSVTFDGATVAPGADNNYTIYVTKKDHQLVVNTSPVVEITLTTTVTGAGTPVVTVKTSNDWTSGNVEGVKIVGYGTLYSNKTFDPSALKDDIAGRSLSGESYNASGVTVHNYYYNDDGINLSALTGYTFSYKFNNFSNSVSAGSRFGAGWIELKQGDTKWIITTASAVALN